MPTPINNLKIRSYITNNETTILPRRDSVFCRSKQLDSARHKTCNVPTYSIHTGEEDLHRTSSEEGGGVIKHKVNLNVVHLSGRHQVLDDALQLRPTGGGEGGGDRGHARQRRDLSEGDGEASKDR